MFERGECSVPVGIKPQFKLSPYHKDEINIKSNRVFSLNVWEGGMFSPCWSQLETMPDGGGGGI